ncbi:LytR/AlgR family response regulator transcription factor [Spirosoma agri]|uniref:Response regulator transcription factor n=1 Tax=Spirosoma agri TaxID=1987381 RepID=A0A6M0IPY3_9BACT|nr:response regulator transcription factor [Spirosoma agri]NEU70389.1 response regulator transcription factor [Spirosoma agri]
MIGSLRCAIIEDEPLAQQLLEKYVRRVPSLDLVATFDDAITAFEQLPAMQPEVIFLDINMPEMTGLEFLQAYPLPHPLVVMTTANPHHALEGFELGVVDYLLKPIAFDRFLKAIGRVKERMPKTAPAPVANNPLSDEARTRSNAGSIAIDSPTADFIYLKTDKKLEQIHLNELVYAEALGDYIKVFLPDRFVVTHLTMTKLAETLPPDRFLRINRSFIIQLRHVKVLEGNSVLLSTGDNLVIGPSYRDAVKERIRREQIG